MGLTCELRTKPTIMRTHTFLWFGLALMLASLMSCTTPQKLTEQGAYDEAVDLAIRRMAGKKSKKTEHVRALELAFQKATQRDLDAAERLRNQNRAEHWPRINFHYRSIRQRQQAVEPLLPLVSRDGVKAEFRFVRIDGLENESREKAADFHYQNAVQLLERAEKGDKMAARQAYEELKRIYFYYPSYRDVDALMLRARRLGTSRVLLLVENESPTLLSTALAERLSDLGRQGLDGFWTAYFTEQGSETDFDYTALLRIRALEISPALVQQRQYEEFREVEDGLEYLLDERGNVAKDSLGNDIKVPRLLRVGAQIVEQHQQQTARIEARLELRDLRQQQLIGTQPLRAASTFEHYAATFRGDERALAEQTRKRIGSQPLPFPAPETLLLQAVGQWQGWAGLIAAI